VNYGVTFDMFSKISVAGDNRHPLYDALTAAGEGAVQWNFEKFLVARDGTVVGHYRSATDPADPVLLEALEAELRK
jgi:glutathione peroxidase